MQRHFAQNHAGGHTASRTIARLLLGAAMIAGTGIAAGGPAFGARAQTAHTTHIAVINPLLANEAQAMTAHRTQSLREHKASMISVMVRSQHSVSADIARLGGTVIASVGGAVTAA